MIFPKINGTSHCFRSRPHNLIATSFALWIFQVYRDLRKLVATFFQFVPTIVESRPDVFCCYWFPLFLAVDVTTTISCRELIVLPFVEIYVATSISVASYVDLCCDHVFLVLNKFCVVTSVPCRDLAILLSTSFCVATLKACHDTISVVSH